MCPCAIVRCIDFLLSILRSKNVEIVIEECSVEELKCLVEIIYNSKTYFHTTSETCSSEKLCDYFETHKQLDVNFVRRLFIDHQIVLKCVITNILTLLFEQSIEYVCT
jgi:spore coat polysaccharide biosynthesis protein SpsF (cytidylyltransferase family)